MRKGRKKLFGIDFVIFGEDGLLNLFKGDFFLSSDSFAIFVFRTSGENFSVEGTDFHSDFTILGFDRNKFPFQNLSLGLINADTESGGFGENDFSEFGNVRWFG